MVRGRSPLEYVLSGARRRLPMITVGLGGLIVGGCPTNTPSSEEVVAPPPVFEVPSAPPVNRAGQYPVIIVSDDDYHGKEGIVHIFSSGTELSYGDVFVSTKGEGALRRIVGSPMDRGSGLIGFETESVPLTDVVDNGSFTFVNSKADLTSASISLFHFNNDFEFGAGEASNLFHVGTTGTLDAQLDIDVGFEIRDHALDFFETSLRGTVSLEADIFSDMYSQGRVYEEIPLAEGSATYYGLIGGSLPVVVTARLNLDALAVADVFGSGHYYNEVSASSFTNLGARYVRGAGWDPVVEQDFEFGVGTPDACASGVAGAVAVVGPRLSLELYGVEVGSVGLNFGFGGLIYGANCFFDDEGGEYRLDASANIRAPADFGLEVFSYNLDAYKTDDLFDGALVWNTIYGNAQLPDWPGDSAYYGEDYFDQLGGSSDGGFGGGGSNGSSGGGSGSGDDSDDGGSGGGSGNDPCGGASGIVFYSESEPNDDLSQPDSWNLTCRDYVVAGSISSLGDRDYFRFTYAPLSDGNYAWYLRSGGGSVQIREVDRTSTSLEIYVEPTQSAGFPLPYEVGLVDGSQ